jgi:hypothetical protein
LILLKNPIRAKNWDIRRYGSIRENRFQASFPAAILAHPNFGDGFSAESMFDIIPKRDNGWGPRFA